MDSWKVYWILTFCWMLLLLAGSHPMAQACDSGSHHSALYHYNRSEAVILAQLQRLRPYTTKAGTKVWKFCVETNYKSTDSTAYATITYVHIPPGPAALLERRQTYLLYLTPRRDTLVWQCERPLLASDSTTQQQLTVLQQLSPQHSGWVEERSPYGRTWAMGQMQAGQPVGIWRYYAYSGELQLQGRHSSDTTVWEQYHHTLDVTYTIIHQIYTGAYYAQTGDYQVIARDTLPVGTYRYRLQYTVGQDTLTEEWCHRHQQVSQRTTYNGLWRHGVEERYNLAGDCIRRYHFQQGWLQGAFWERKPLPQGRPGYVEIQGTYHQDEKVEEWHCYYRPDHSFEREEVLLHKGKWLHLLIE